MTLFLMTAYLAIADDYRYVSSREKVYHHQIGDLIWRGTVNEAGDFVPDTETPPRAAKVFITGGETHLFSASRARAPVFEYRFGRLIPGELHQSEFIPQIGGKVIDMKEYMRNYSRASPRVYNLPGKIVTKLEYEELKAAGKLTDEDK